MRPAKEQFSIDLGRGGNSRTILGRWADRARRGLELAPSQPFEPFIYAYIALNGWAACCTLTDIDQFQVEAMAADPRIESEFQTMCLADLEYLISAETFRDFWPIFKAADLRRREIRRGGWERRQVVDGYLAENPPVEYAPSCYPKHVADGYPLDWAHTVDAIYRVRCNLFHGEKAMNCENDRFIVSAAANVLVPFVARLITMRR